MLSKTNRLTKKRELERVFKKGKGFKEDFLILTAQPESGEKRRLKKQRAGNNGQLIVKPCL